MKLIVALVEQKKDLVLTFVKQRQFFLSLHCSAVICM